MFICVFQVFKVFLEYTVALPAMMNQKDLLYWPSCLVWLKRIKSHPVWLKRPSSLTDCLNYLTSYPQHAWNHYANHPPFHNYISSILVHIVVVWSLKHSHLGTTEESTPFTSNPNQTRPHFCPPIQLRNINDCICFSMFWKLCITHFCHLTILCSLPVLQKFHLQIKANKWNFKPFFFFVKASSQVPAVPFWRPNEACCYG